MSAPNGNQFWKLRPTHGRKPIYDNPEDFEKDCLEYFELTSQRTDLNKQHWVGKDGEEVEIKVMPPFTKSGLCIFLGMTTNTFNEYKKLKDFSSIITRIEEIIYTQKLEGATTGHYNATIVSREIGLKEQTEQSGETTVRVVYDNKDGI